ncbi:hypothetical protein N0V93_001068 [Gnomoniopsis smithogilvyi]|uniref:DUF1750-domain-containing protein n=1 Tax=Gnomoniopsis smithogilvyi TaxID=1191159 RepID=A0A9W9D2D8_9PEZI|nr:hypothetical protein N0V93_001068 [Gnomoniopsis smithogilvyi]
MADPSSSVHDRMLPHLHLVSTFRYPERTHLSLQDQQSTTFLVNMLVNAPKIARDTAPFFWTYLDCPRDGQIMLTWQPLQRLGTNFASDGYIWPGPDEFQRLDLKNGLVLESFSQRIGYRPGEEVAAHARTRFRLVPANNAQPSPNTPQVDATLWLVHYGPSQQVMPVQMLPIPAPMHGIMNARSTLQRGGQIPRKEFMLADRTNWPTIHPPQLARGHPMMVQPGNARNVPQSMAYSTPSKRSRTAAHTQPHMVPAPAPFIAFDEEEDTSAGDMFDHMTPRELSMARYTRNHEWMEEVLGSAYRIGQITPSDLGLGLQGELSSVTQGIFEASGVDAHKKPPTKPVIGHLDAELADQFRKRVADKILADQAEIAKMKADHEKQMAKLKANSILTRSEKELRVAVDETGPEFWRLEGKEEEGGHEGTSPFSTKQHRKADDIVAEIESALGRHIEVVSDVKRVQDGGYQEPAPEPEALPVPPPAPVQDLNVPGQGQSSGPPIHNGPQTSGAMAGEGDVDMGGTTAGPLDQTQTAVSSSSTPQAHLSANPSAMATPGNLAVPSPQAFPGQVATTNTSEDITMQDADQAKDISTAPDQGTGSGDWVVVPKGGMSPGASAMGSAAPASNAGPSEPAQTPGDFGDMNTAGEALSSYGQHNDGEIGDGMDLGGVEDSAFGDAVFGVEESRGSAANTPADGI